MTKKTIDTLSTKSITSQDHTIECMNARSKWNADRLLYWYEWPYHCRTCNGWGGKYSWYDPSPAGVSLSAGQMLVRRQSRRLDFEPCPDCIETCKCPRCGLIVPEETWLDDVSRPCPFCGWETEMEGIPEEPECRCGPYDSTIYEDALE